MKYLFCLVILVLEFTGVFSQRMTPMWHPTHSAWKGLPDSVISNSSNVSSNNSNKNYSSLNNQSNNNSNWQNPYRPATSYNFNNNENDVSKEYQKIMNELNNINSSGYDCETAKRKLNELLNNELSSLSKISGSTEAKNRLRQYQSELNAEDCSTENNSTSIGFESTSKKNNSKVVPGTAAPAIIFNEATEKLQKSVEREINNLNNTNIEIPKEEKESKEVINKVIENKSSGSEDSFDEIDLKKVEKVDTSSINSIDNITPDDKNMPQNNSNEGVNNTETIKNNSTSAEEFNKWHENSIKFLSDLSNYDTNGRLISEEERAKAVAKLPKEDRDMLERAQSINDSNTASSMLDISYHTRNSLKNDRMYVQQSKETALKRYFNSDDGELLNNDINRNDQMTDKRLMSDGLDVTYLNGNGIDRSVIVVEKTPDQGPYMYRRMIIQTDFVTGREKAISTPPRDDFEEIERNNNKNF